jgi:hypothetical protein
MDFTIKITSYLDFQSLVNYYYLVLIKMRCYQESTYSLFSNVINFNLYMCCQYIINLFAFTIAFIN